MRSSALTTCILQLFTLIWAASGEDKFNGVSETYDYVVIGGGTAGLAIASRLSQIASVAVIEAGGFYEQDNGNLSTVPALAVTIPFIATQPGYPQNPLMDWNYVSIPQSAAGNRTIHYAQGKTLGGSSGINTMAFHRGTKGTFQRWADLVGDQSYTFPNVLPFFKKSTHLTPPDFAKRNTPNATFEYDVSAFDNSLGGPLQVSWADWVDPTITWLQKALVSLGIPESKEGFNSGKLTATGAYVTTTVDPRNATRSSSRTSYMETIGLPAGLKVYHHTLTRKILFRGTRASAVQILSANNTLSTLAARKEVILSAGAFGSPHLLLVSGVGPTATLKKFGIPLVADLAGVGQNLWEHIYFPVINMVTTPSGQQLADADPVTANRQYYEEQWGPLSSISRYLAFEKVPASLRNTLSSATKTALTWFPADWPEVEYLAAGIGGPGGTSLGALAVSLIAPLSRGSVTIRSADPSVPPVIDLGWLTNPADGEVAVAGLKRVRAAWATISSIVVGPEIAPGPGVQTDAEILAYIRNSATQIFHAAATCAMGKKGDRKAVVDSNARVFGVQGLRVVDASAFPFQVPGHPQSAVYMLAEKIADAIIKGR